LATTSVTDFASFINRQIVVQEKIEVCLWQLGAFLTVTTVDPDMLKLIPTDTLHMFLSIARDLVEKATKINQERLGELMQHAKHGENIAML